MNAREVLWTLDELGAQVALALSVDYSAPNNGRVRAVPDRRTIRYYTTLGLLDAPAKMRGRTALYSRRHLCQLVAIKRLQSQGLTLNEIQGRLLGLTERALRKLANLPEEPAEATSTNEPSEREETFWKSVPERPTETNEADPETESTRKFPRQLTVYPLTEGLSLMIEAARSADEHDLEALRVAAEPLIKLLRTRRLLGSEADVSKDQEYGT